MCVPMMCVHAEHYAYMCMHTCRHCENMCMVPYMCMHTFIEYTSIYRGKINTVCVHADIVNTCVWFNVAMEQDHTCVHMCP